MKKLCLLFLSLLVFSFAHAQDDPLFTRYSDLMRSDKKNSQVWALCAAAAMAKSRYTPSQFEQYAKRTVSSLKNIVGSNGECPCSDVLGEYWNAAKAGSNNSPGNNNNNPKASTSNNQGKSQTYPIRTRYWNGQLGYDITDTIGLRVAAKEIPLCNHLERVPKASLSGQPEQLVFKRRFVLYFIVENVSQNDIAIYDWAFRSVCPRDNMDRMWDAQSMVNLVTPYIPNDIYIVLKPGERKRFFSGITDFFWCLGKSDCNLLEAPQYFQAIMTCSSLGPGVQSPKPPGKWDPPQNDPKNSCVTSSNPTGDPLLGPLDPALDKAIRDYRQLVAQRRTKDAKLFEASILESTAIVYPHKWSEVRTRMGLAPLALKDAKLKGCYAEVLSKAKSADSSNLAANNHNKAGSGKEMAVNEDDIPGYNMSSGNDAFLVTEFRGTYRGVYLAYIKQDINMNNISAMKVETHVLKHYGEKGAWRKSKQKAALLGFYPQSSVNERQADIDYTWIGKPNPYDKHTEIPSNYFTETTSLADYSNHAPYFAKKDPTLVAFKITGDKGSHSYATWLIGTPLEAADPTASLGTYYLYSQTNAYNRSQGGETYYSTDITQYIDDPMSVCFEGSVRPGDVHAWIGAGDKLIKATATGTSPHELGTPYMLNGRISKIRVRENYTWVLAGTSLYRVDNYGKLELFLNTNATSFAADKDYVYTNDGLKTSISNKKSEPLLGDKAAATSNKSAYNDLKQGMQSMDMEVAEGDNRLFFVDIASGKLYWISTR